MRIVDLHEEWTEDTKKVTAEVVWERRSHAPQQITVAVGNQHAEMLGTNPNAFLVGAVWPAMYHFERRLSVEGEVCPLLVDNLTAAMRLVSDWYRDARPIAIEGDIAAEPFKPAPGGKAGLMFSGGLDSLASLLVNREQYMPSDEEWFYYGPVVGSGFDAFDASPGGPYWPELKAMADDAALNLVPLATNLRELEPADHFFGRYLHGALLAMVGHSLARSLDKLAIASTSPDGSVPWGSHPDLDPLFTSGDLVVTHDLATMERHDKTAVIADWPILRDRLRVCLNANRLPPGTWNCSSCEKCMRTMLSLAALDRLEEFRVFDPSFLTVDRIETMSIRPSSLRHYPAIQEALEGSGRHELAEAVRRRLIPGTVPMGWGKRLREAERRYLRGALRRTKRRFFG